ncbi:hypothetical protein FJ641_07450 [Clostridium perfringens]|nr:hypothetical protein [Clostridium perfringens]
MYLVKFKKFSKGYIVESIKQGLTVALISGEDRKEIINKVESEIEQRENKLRCIPYEYKNKYIQGIEVYKQILKELIY